MRSDKTELVQCGSARHFVPDAVSNAANFKQHRNFVSVFVRRAYADLIAAQVKYARRYILANDLSYGIKKGLCRPFESRNIELELVHRAANGHNCYEFGKVISAFAPIAIVDWAQRFLPIPQLLARNPSKFCDLSCWNTLYWHNLKSRLTKEMKCA